MTYGYMISFLLALLAPMKNNSVLFSSSFVISEKRQKTLVGKNNHYVVLKYGSTNDEVEELENARARFERLMQYQHEHSFVAKVGESLVTDSYSTMRTRASSPPMNKEDYVPILTESFRRRLEMEIELLSTLETSDDGIDALIQFWLKERDHESAKRMKEIEQFCTPTHIAEEHFFRRVIGKYGYDWVEPMSRLALLLLVNERYAECEYWCKVALAVKPWHFEVTQILIMSAKRQNDSEKARKWSEISLPPLEESEKRKAWVQQALKDANDSMERAQMAKSAANKKLQQRAMNRWESPPSSSFFVDPDESWQ